MIIDAARMRPLMHKNVIVLKSDIHHNGDQYDILGRITRIGEYGVTLTTRVQGDIHLYWAEIADVQIARAREYGEELDVIARIMDVAHRLNGMSESGGLDRNALHGWNLPETLIGWDNVRIMALSVGRRDLADKFSRAAYAMFGATV